MNIHKSWPTDVILGLVLMEVQTFIVLMMGPLNQNHPNVWVSCGWNGQQMKIKFYLGVYENYYYQIDQMYYYYKMILLTFFILLFCRWVSKAWYFTFS